MDYADELEAARAGALGFANVLRAHDGRDSLPALVMGVGRDCCECPIARTANQGVRRDVARWEIGRGGAIKVTRSGNLKGDPVPMTPSAIEFMAAFDAGAYPDLDARLVRA